MQIRRYMAEQPRAIVEGYTAAADSLAGWALDGVERVLLVGSGSSLNAARLAAPAIADAIDGDVEVLGPLEFMSRGRAPRTGATLIVVTTQGGASTTSVEALGKAAGSGGRALLVTAAPDGPAAGLGAPTVLLPIGEEPIGPKTKGFAASCAALLALAARLGGDVPPPDRLLAAIEAALEDAAAPAEALAEDGDDLDYVLIAGDGENLGVALEASLKIAEIAGVPTAAFTLEEAMHGRLHGLTPRGLCLLVVSDDAGRRQAARAQRAMAALGVRVVVLEVGATADLAAPWSALAATFLLQHLAVALCRRRGRDPDLMRYPGLTAELAIKMDDQP